MAAKIIKFPDIPEPIRKNSVAKAKPASKDSKYKPMPRELYLRFKNFQYPDYVILKDNGYTRLENDEDDQTVRDMLGYFGLGYLHYTEQPGHQRFMIRTIQIAYLDAVYNCSHNPEAFAASYKPFKTPYRKKWVAFIRLVAKQSALLFGEEDRTYLLENDMRRLMREEDITKDQEKGYL